MTTLGAVLMILAVARVTRLITMDRLTAAVRVAAVRALLGRPRQQARESGFRYELAYLITCDWCSSMYVGAAGAGAWYAWGETLPFMAVCAALAASYVTGFLASVTERGE